MKRITEGEKKETSPGLQSLLSQQSGMWGYSSYQQSGAYGGGNMLASLGLGGMLGH